MASLLHRTAGVLSSLLLAAGATAFLAAPAHAEDGYRYWMYFHLSDGAWTFAETGPADQVPEDGDVEGFRFGVSTAAAGVEPRADLAEVDFDAVCAGSEAGEGQKRVALLLDYGDLDADAPEPRGACAVVDRDASTQDALQDVAQVRIEGGMTCAVDGYPASGCGEAVPDADIPADEEPVAFALPASAAADDTDPATQAADAGEAGTADEDPAAAPAAETAEGSDAVTALVVVGTLVAVLGMLALLVNQRRRRRA